MTESDNIRIVSERIQKNARKFEKILEKRAALLEIVD